jgi:hypothetical protein
MSVTPSSESAYLSWLVKLADIDLLLPVQVSQLAGRPVQLVEFSPELPTTLLTVHGPSQDNISDVRYGTATGNMHIRRAGHNFRCPLISPLSVDQRNSAYCSF